MKFLRIAILPLMFLAACTSSNKSDDGADVGFYVVNEGSFGRTLGSVTYVHPDSTDVRTDVVSDLGNTTCYGAKWEGSYYFVSKQGRRLVRCDEKTMVQGATLDELGGDGRAFVGIDKKTGAVSTRDGVFRLTLEPLLLGAVVEGTQGVQCGGMYAIGGYLYVINQDKGLQIFDIAKNYVLVKEHAGVSTGFTRAKDGSMWAAGETFLVRIDPRNLEVKELSLPDGAKIYNSWGSWNAGSLCSGVEENVLYFTKSDSEWGGGNAIYRYDIAEDKLTSWTASTDSEDAFYGAGLGVDPHTGNVVATYVKGYDFNDNRLVVFDWKTGKEKSRITYSGYWFPAMLMFNR